MEREKRKERKKRRREKKRGMRQEGRREGKGYGKKGKGGSFFTLLLLLLIVEACFFLCSILALGLSICLFFYFAFAVFRQACTLLVMYRRVNCVN